MSPRRRRALVAATLALPYLAAAGIWMARSGADAPAPARSGRCPRSSTSPRWARWQPASHRMPRCAGRFQGFAMRCRVSAGDRAARRGSHGSTPSACRAPRGIATLQWPCRWIQAGIGSGGGRCSRGRSPLGSGCRPQAPAPSRCESTCLTGLRMTLATARWGTSPRARRKPCASSAHWSADRSGFRATSPRVALNRAGDVSDDVCGEHLDPVGRCAEPPTHPPRDALQRPRPNTQQSLAVPRTGLEPRKEDVEIRRGKVARLARSLRRLPR